MACARSFVAEALVSCPWRLALGRRAQVCARQWQWQCRNFNTTTPIIEADSIPDSIPSNVSFSVRGRPAPESSDAHWEKTHPVSSLRTTPSISTPSQQVPSDRSHTPRYALERAPTAPSPFPFGPAVKEYTPEFLAQLIHLAGQTPHYITIHIHGKPYLVTAGDSIRLPFLMHGVLPGDILRLDRASVLGSREYTLRAGTSTLPRLGSTQAQMPTPSAASLSQPIIGRTDDLHPSSTRATPHEGTSSQLRTSRPKLENKLGFLDPDLFVCRATVLGTESEPLRTMEKTKRRQRHIRHIRSKHRYTILRISEVQIRVPDIGLEL